MRTPTSCYGLEYSPDGLPGPTMTSLEQALLSVNGEPIVTWSPSILGIAFGLSFAFVLLGLYFFARAVVSLLPTDRFKQALRVFWCEWRGHRWGQPYSTLTWYGDGRKIVPVESSYPNRRDCQRCGKTGVVQPLPPLHPNCRCAMDIIEAKRQDRPPHAREHSDSPYPMGLGTATEVRNDEV